MFLQDQLGNELCNALNIQKLADVDLLRQTLTGSLVTLQLLQTQLQTSALTLVSHTAAKEIGDQARRQIVRVVVEIFAAKSNSLHHGLLGAHLVGE